MRQLVFILVALGIAVPSATLCVRTRHLFWRQGFNEWSKNGAYSPRMMASLHRLFQVIFLAFAFVVIAAFLFTQCVLLGEGCIGIAMIVLVLSPALLIFAATLTILALYHVIRVLALVRTGQHRVEPSDLT